MQLRAVLESEDWDGLLITNQDNRYFATGYRASDHSGRSAGAAIITPDQAVLITSANNVAWAATDAPNFEAIAWSTPWEESVAKWLAGAGVKRLGFEASSLPVASYDALRKAAPAIDFIPVSNQIDRLRWVKTPQEIEFHRQAIEITDKAYERALSALRPGVTERETASLISMAFLEFGAEGWGFPPTVAFGQNAAKPHHNSGDALLREGESIIMDIGASVAGYTADLTRTNWIGEPSAKLCDMYGTVLAAQEEAKSAVRAGALGADVDAAARDIITVAGYGEAFVHGTGHGIGVRVHDGPFLHASNREPLEAGTVLTIEPGIYIEDFGGVRIEDVVLVTDDGYQLLSHAPKNPRVS